MRGQEARGTLLGRVTDQSDAVVAGAKVEAANADTGVRLESVTNRSGDYIFPLLSPGTYSIRVESSGFKTVTRGGIQVRVNDQVAINVTMEVGQSTQTVQVSSESPLLDTSSAAIGFVVEPRAIMELPLKDGMVLTMATLAPALWNTRAISAPMPPVAPVTSAVLPVRSNMLAP